MVLKPKQSFSLPIELRTSDRGRYNGRLEIVFKVPNHDWSFVIVRMIKAIVGSGAEHGRLKPKEPYRRRKLPPWKNGPVTPGMDAPRKQIPYIRKLPKAPIPPEFSPVLTGKGSVSEVARKFKQAFMPSTLDSMTHGKHFAPLLWAEEFTQE